MSRSVEHPPYLREGTSHDAAHSVKDHTPTLRERVYKTMWVSGKWGRTDEELAEILGLDLNTARPRRWELEREGKIVDSGMRRKTRSGRSAIVWTLAERQGELAL